ncbi:MAG: hypothetical protein O3C45_03240 [Bacteroidetes bacterium]|nr:hypothetical protein [Bacteroidota bacterium]MDA0874056.1 hypothetical protein [Bacteroidota bacterium]
MPSHVSHQDLDAAIEAAIRRLGPAAGRARIEEEAWQWLQGTSQKPSSASSSAVFLSSSAIPAISRKPSTQRSRLYDSLRKLVLTAVDLDPDPDPALVLHVRETSMLLPGRASSVWDDTALTLADLAEDTRLDTVYAPFLDLALEENGRWLDRIPDALGLHPALLPSFQIATQDNGWADWLVEGLAWALAAASTGGIRGRAIISVNDCDRRAFGHRVHPETVVHYRLGHPASQDGPRRDAETGWLRVGTADLPIHPFLSTGRPTDLHRTLSRGADPASILNLLHTELLDSMHSGARKQMLLTW